MFTLQQTINFAKPFVNYSPLSVSSNNGEMAVSTASMIRCSILGVPMTYAWNRAESSVAVVSGTQDYLMSLTDFGFMEKATITDDQGVVTEIDTVLNQQPLSYAAAGSARPNALSVLYLVPYTSITVRLLDPPTASYTLKVIYQKIAQPFTDLSDTWDPIPDFYKDVYNNLFLAEALTLLEDPRATTYRVRGVSAMFAKAQGLSDTQKNIFAQQWLADESEMAAVGLSTQLGTQSRLA